MITPRKTPLGETLPARLIFQERIVCGWSQVRLARESGFSGAFICQVESGKRIPSVESLDRILSAMRSTPSASPEGWAALPPRDRILVQAVIARLLGRRGSSRTPAMDLEDRR